MDWDDIIGLAGIAALATGVGFYRESWPAGLIVVGVCLLAATAVSLLSQLIREARR
jgi:hypothetical protein